jgi:hydroxymethylbilane synthase
VALAAVPKREEPRDALVLPDGKRGELGDLPSGARVGTGSLRRRAQLLHARPDLRVETVRGNVDTRLRKLDEGEFDALVLAAAGLRRLRLAGRIAALLSPEVCLPAPGQGALGIQCRDGDEAVHERLQALEDAHAREAVEAERALMVAIGGGCSVPLGGWARREGGVLRLDAVLAGADGARLARTGAAGDPRNPHELGRRVAEMLREEAGLG